MAGTQTSVYLLIAHFLSCILVCRQDSSGAARDNGVSESSRRFRTEFLQEWPQQAGAPSFDPSTPHNVTGLVGTTVSLACRVRNLRNRTVSWVRHRDIHLLTVGRYTYTSDQRFEAQHRPRSEEWALLIRSPQRRDSGQYECQISTTPPIGHSVHLSIVEPETTIQSGPDLFIYAGSTINLTCTVRHTPSPPESISWSHKGQVINFDSSRGGISLVTEKGASSNSRLLVQRARAADAGVYSCAPDKAPTASTRVHVLTGTLATCNFFEKKGGISLVTSKGTSSNSRLFVQRTRAANAGVNLCAPVKAPTASTRVHVLTDESPAAMHGGVHTCARSLPSALLAAACSLGLPALMRARFLCR